jgi:hypothetical protein
MTSQKEVARAVTQMKLTSADQLVIVSGAGISTEHPTHAPAGVPLMEQAMNDFFLKGTIEMMRAAYKKLHEVTQQPAELFSGRPRLEAVLDVVSRSYTPRALAHLTPNFTNRPSNRNHHLLAAHLAAGGRQVTANFDRFIEHVTVRGAGAPFHFHGEVERPRKTLPFGARLNAIEHGFDDITRVRTLAPIVDPKTKVLAFIGYSFSDYFDATPALVSAIDSGALDGTAILWLKHEWTDPVVEIDPASDRAYGVIPSALARGLKVVRVTGRSGDALYQILNAVGCTVDPTWANEETCTCPKRVRPRRYRTTPENRRAATARLLARFGMLGKIPTSGLDLQVSDVPIGDVGEYWWKRGDYQKGRACALAGVEPSDPHAEARRELIDARYHWIEGRYIRGARAVLTALRRLDADPAAPVPLVAEALERYGRIAVHMHRTPDARLFLLPAFRRRLPDYERRVEDLAARAREVGGTPLSHVRDALANYRKEVLGHPSPTSNRTSANARALLIERLSQAESLDAYVDYIRGNANIGDYAFPVTDGDWHKPMKQLYEVIGNTADQDRLSLFQPLRNGSHHPLRAALSLDASWWHRLRMVVGSWVKRYRP